MTKASDIRTKTADELQDQLLGLKKEQFNLRFQIENTARVRQIRRDIARVKTIQAQKAASAAKAK